MESINIRTTIQQSVEGDSKAFAELYEHLVQRVFAFVATRVSERHVAQEVTQDIFVELHKSLPKFSYHSDAAFYAYVFTIVRRQLAARYGLQKKHQVVELDETVFSIKEQSAEVTHSVQSALETLDECTREIVVLHHWSRFTFAEIGALINMTESAVRVRHHRARAHLASVLNA